MNGKDLFNGMSFVEERLVNEAETERPASVGFVWKRGMAMAACLCILIAGVISVWDHLPFYTRSGDAADSQESVLDQESAMSQILQETSENEYGMNLPSDVSLGQVSSVILRVDSLTDSGFVGTVAEVVDTDVIPVGTCLNVIMTEDANNERKKENGKPAESVSGAAVPMVGSLLRVQFVEYDAASCTIYVNMISPEEN